MVALNDFSDRSRIIDVSSAYCDIKYWLLLILIPVISSLFLILIDSISAHYKNHIRY